MAQGLLNRSPELLKHYHLKLYCVMIKLSTPFLNKTNSWQKIPSGDYYGIFARQGGRPLLFINFADPRPCQNSAPAKLKP
jgi:hypothetical protein